MRARRPRPIPRSASPLRYAGGKARLAPVLAERIAAVAPGRPVTLIEPFAGGAGLSLALLQSGAIDRAIVADGDPLVAAFWDTVTDPAGAKALAQWALAQTPTLADWDRWRATNPSTPMEAARKALYLSRTSFSGLLTHGAGPIGGRAQSGRYGIDCRWSPRSLARKLERIGDLGAAGRLVSWGRLDWRETLARAAEMENVVVVYLDPPYAGASNLYAREFSESDHRDLAAALPRLRVPWILSYDDHPTIRKLYSAARVSTVPHTYSAAGERTSNAGATELLIEPPTVMSRVVLTPEIDRLITGVARGSGVGRRVVSADAALSSDDVVQALRAEALRLLAKRPLMSMACLATSLHRHVTRELMAPLGLGSSRQAARARAALARLEADPFYSVATEAEQEAMRADVLASQKLLDPGPEPSAVPLDPDDSALRDEAVMCDEDAVAAQASVRGLRASLAGMDLTDVPAPTRAAMVALLAGDLDPDDRSPAVEAALVQLRRIFGAGPEAEVEVEVEVEPARDRAA